ncbi:hypothetical protein GCM10027589_36950 [Actinocorallia lasiicapitis]
MNTRPVGFTAVLVLLLSMITVLFPAPAIAAGPAFELPVPCGQRWTTSTHSEHKSQYMVDMISVSGTTQGTPALASEGGRVTVSQFDGEAGNFIVIDHGGGWQTRYLHLDRRDVAVGNDVQRGRQIGLVGNTGSWTSGAHLHYEQKLNGVVVQATFNGHLVPVRWDYNQHFETSANCGNTPAPVRRPYASGRVVSGRSADGRLEVFAAAASGVHHAWQTAPNGGWSAWENLGGPQNAQLAIVPNADGRLELFALSNSTLDHIWQTAPNAGWSNWQNFGTGGHRIAAGNNADGRIEVFASNSSGVFHRWQTSPTAWSGWTGTNGPANSRLAMETAPDGRLEVFALSDATFGHLFQTAPSGGWGAWEDFGTGGQEVTVNHNTDGRLEVFASNSTGVFHRWQTSPTAWSGWVGTNGPANSKLSSARTPDGRVEVFAMSNQTAAHIWQTGQNQAFSAWETFGGPGTSVTATNNADGRIDVFGTNSTGVYHRWQTSLTAWSNWDQVNGPGPAMP